MNRVRGVVIALLLGAGVLAAAASTAYEEVSWECTSSWTCGELVVDMDCEGPEGEQACTCSNDSTCEQQSYCNHIVDFDSNKAEDGGRAEYTPTLVDDVEGCCGVDLSGTCDISYDVSKRNESGARTSVSTGAR